MPLKLKSIEGNHITLVETEVTKIILTHSKKYCLVNAVNLGLLSEYVYKHIENIQINPLKNLTLSKRLTWKSGAANSCGPIQAPYTGRQEYFCANLTPIKHSNKPTIDTQAFHYNDDENNVLIFRGTKELYDLLTDLSAEKVDYPYAPTHGKVHGGFFKGFDCVRSQIEDVFNKPENQKCTTILAGHSLGGALATLAAAFIAEKYHDKPCGKVMVYTYGSPRVGEKKWVEYFNTTRPIIHFRHRHHNDLVPTLPPNHLNMRVPTLAKTAFGLRAGLVGTSLVVLSTLQTSGSEEAFVHHGTPLLISYLNNGNPLLIQGSGTAETVIADGKYFHSKEVVFGKEFVGIVCHALDLSDHGTAHYNGCLAQLLKEAVNGMDQNPEALITKWKKAKDIFTRQIEELEKLLLQDTVSLKWNAPADATRTEAARDRITEPEIKNIIADQINEARFGKLFANRQIENWSLPSAKKFLQYYVLPGNLTKYEEEELEYHGSNIRFM